MRGLKRRLPAGGRRRRSRTPHGVRGLKLFLPAQCLNAAESHPTRRAWIETGKTTKWTSPKRRTPHGVRGLKQFALHAVVGVLRRTPHGVRGLKPDLHLLINTRLVSHPTRGAWIETWHGRNTTAAHDVAPHTGHVD